jgi:hypothetical protein
LSAGFAGRLREPAGGVAASYSFVGGADEPLAQKTFSKNLVSHSDLLA